MRWRELHHTRAQVSNSVFYGAPSTFWFYLAAIVDDRCAPVDKLLVVDAPIAINV
eukprot:m.139472 g.139472  ORF g.139472 m.139472 type:complete len:55 (+) comp9993_c0_seq2:259-423(+)